MTYVGCSRVTSLQGLCLDPADIGASQWQRFQNINNTKGHQDRRAVDKDLQRMNAALERENQQA